MTDREPTEVTNLDRYGSDALPWSRAGERLATEMPDAATPAFLSTVNADGRPHSAGIGPAYVDGAVYFTSGPGTLKSRNLADRPACTLSLRFTGLDLVLDGEAARVTDAETIDAVTAAYRAGGWPAERDGDAITAPFSAPSAGPAPWYLYRFTFHQAVGVASAEPYGSTRWRFATG